MNRLRTIPWSLLIVAALLLGLAPFAPQPHLVEKLGMLAAGELSRPLDIFDLFLHGAPVVLLMLKAGMVLFGKKEVGR
uniref:RND transporter n=1 Tax=Candidatus Kentrum sp. DK TaxID=2126562 RepID=A0A450SPC1_9GAMM|nr:MAG: hypothetical protein BECKDK2373B_GA0170837_105412 [Candidatus Kentron sp. DK]